MVKIATRFFLVLAALCTFAQNNAIDSMVASLQKKPLQTDKSKTFNAIAEAYKTTDAVVMQDYANKALTEAKKKKNAPEQGNAYHHLGNSNIILGNYAIALDYFSKAQTLYENLLLTATPATKKEIQNGLARAYGSIGVVFIEQSNYSKALQYNFKALKLYEATNNEEKLASIYNNIGVVYNTENEWFKAIVYYEKCLKIQEKKPNDLLASFISNLGLVYLNQKNYPKALEYFNKSKSYFDQFPNTRGLGLLYNNLGIYYSTTENNSKAIYFIKNAIILFESIDNKFGIADSNLKLGAIYSKQKNSKVAIKHINKALIISRELGVFSFVREGEEMLSEIYEKQGNAPLALTHYKLFNTAKDSISNETTLENSLRAELNFEFDRKEMVSKEAQMKRDIVIAEQTKSQKWKILYSVLLALFGSGIAFLIYNSTQLKKNLTLEKELAIYEQKALHLQMNPHFIFNCLGSISSFIVQNSTDAAIKYLAKFSKLMRLTLEYSKESLIPIDKEIESLQNYLELEQLRFNHCFDFKISKSKEIEDDVALPPLLLQPFVENAIIHGMNPKNKDGSIQVGFKIEEQTLVCTIVDNGIGINKSKDMKKSLVTMHKSMALDITKKRLEMLESSTTQKANVTIDELSNNGEVVGTKVVLCLPLQYLNTLSA